MSTELTESPRMHLRKRLAFGRHVTAPLMIRRLGEVNARPGAIGHTPEANDTMDGIFN
jgi:hypothetical protein